MIPKSVIWCLKSKRKGVYRCDPHSCKDECNNFHKKKVKKKKNSLCVTYFFNRIMISNVTLICIFDETRSLIEYIM